MQLSARGGRQNRLLRIANQRFVPWFLTYFNILVIILNVYFHLIWILQRHAVLQLYVLQIVFRQIRPVLQCLFTQLLHHDVRLRLRLLLLLSLGRARFHRILVLLLSSTLLVALLHVLLRLRRVVILVSHFVNATLIHQIQVCTLLIKHLILLWLAHQLFQPAKTGCAAFWMTRHSFTYIVWYKGLDMIVFTLIHGLVLIHIWQLAARISLRLQIVVWVTRRRQMVLQLLMKWLYL